ncbi:MAG TPA: maleylpyruvate isomerase family mycothiol-dependent enzyme [Pseudonocardiaceae bacterium]|jgi:uncharacterized protein (TIGR03083 family)|nr:maleylpyruvate isomerase family mycothiol-dependent enzyme [Pseudonocardiaceae bacterium]
MTPSQVELIEANNRAFTAAVRTPGALRGPVPSCPGWTVADLVEHLGQVQTWWRYALLGNGRRPNEHPEFDADSKPDGDLLGWWLRRSTEFVDTLRAAPADGRYWCWWNSAQLDTARALAWRQLHESVVHGWDAATAVGAANSIDAEVAADGVEEFLTRFVPTDGWQGPAGTIVLRADDLGREWARTPGTDGARTVLRGSAEQLDLLLWRRIPLTEVTVAGDEALATAFLGWPRLG